MYKRKLKKNSIPKAAAVAHAALQVAAAAGGGREGVRADVVAVEEGGVVQQGASAHQQGQALPGQTEAARQVQVAQLRQTAPLRQHPEITRQSTEIDSQFQRPVNRLGVSSEKQVRAVFPERLSLQTLW